MIVLLTIQAALAADCTVIAGTTAHLPSGPQKGTTVVVSDARIVAVGKTPQGLKLELDEGKEVASATFRGEACAFVQGAGKQLTAGLIVGPTRLGLVEVGLEQGTRQDDPRSDDPIRAGMVAIDGYDPLSSLIGVARVEGITGAVVAPGGGWISGQAGFVSLAGRTQSEAVVGSSVAMMGGLPSGSVAEGVRAWRELAADVAAWRRDPASFDRQRPYLEGLSRLDLDALTPVFAGQLPLVVYADGAHELEALLRLQEDLGLSLVIEGAAEGWLLAERLASAEIPVIVDPTVYGSGGFDQLHGRSDNPALLSEAGVPVMFQNGRYNVHNARTLRQWAGNAVRGGMAHDAAVRGLTEVPAQTFGLSDRGRVAPGAVADLVLWTGDPLELSSWPDRIWIDGRVIDKVSRQTELRDRYLQLPGVPEPLPLPATE